MNNQSLVRLTKASHDKLRKERDGLERDLRESEDRRRELDTLKKDNTQLIASILIQKNDLHGKNASLQEELQEAKRKIDVLEEERRKAEKDMKSLTAQTREANEAKKAADAVIVNLRKENETVSEKLRACKDDLLVLQPPEQTPDNEVARQLTDLSDHVECWIEQEIYNPQSLEKLDKALTSQHVQPLLGCLGTHLKPEHELLAAQHVSSQRLILCYLILRHLERSILGETVYLFGLDDQRVALLKDVEQGMTALRGM